MAKINCKCGNVIVDQSDAIKWKARFVADQDYDDFLFFLDEPDSIEKRTFTNQAFHEIFQCSSCLSLIVFRHGERQGVFFEAEKKENSSEILKSTYNDKWKGFLTAIFDNESGNVFWYTNIDSGFKQNLSLDQTRQIYYSKHKELLDLDILKNSFLRIDGEIEHKTN
jgi:hypothetical protein